MLEFEASAPAQGEGAFLTKASASHSPGGHFMKTIPDAFFRLVIPEALVTAVAGTNVALSSSKLS